MIKISPAKTFPNNLKEKETIFEISDISSNMPTKKFIGFEKFKNFFMWVANPKTIIPKKFVVKTAIMAKANVKFRSAAGERNKDILL